MADIFSCGGTGDHCMAHTALSTDCSHKSTNLRDSQEYGKGERDVFRRIKNIGQKHGTTDDR